MEFSHTTCKPNVFIIVVIIIILFSHTNKHSMWVVLMQFLSTRLVCVWSYSAYSKHALRNEYLILSYFNCTLLVLFKIILILLLCFYSVDRQMCSLNNSRDTYAMCACRAQKKKKTKGWCSRVCATERWTEFLVWVRLKVWVSIPISTVSASPRRSSRHFFIKYIPCLCQGYASDNLCKTFYHYAQPTELQFQRLHILSYKISSFAPNWRSFLGANI